MFSACYRTLLLAWWARRCVLRGAAVVHTICYVATTLEVGGAERSLVELIRRLDRRRYRPVVCALLSGGALRQELEALDVPVHELGVAAGARELLGLRLWPVLRRERPRIVHGRLVLANLWARTGKLFGARVVCEERGLARDRPQFLSWLNRSTARLCDVLIANSEAVAAVVRSRDGGRARVIHGGVDTIRFHPGSSEACSWDIVSVTRLERYKGVWELLEAFAKVRARRPAMRLALVGDGSERPAIEAWLRREGHAAAVTLLGNRGDVPALLRRGRVFALASHEEGFANAVLEAMATRLPVVATAVGGNVEAVLDGVTGTLVAPGDPTALADALLKYLSDPMRAAHAGAAGLDRVRSRFDVLITAAAYASVYEELLA